MPSKGAGASLKDIEIVATDAGPSVKLHGEAAAAAQSRGIGSFQLSISHADAIAMSVCVAQKA